MKKIIKSEVSRVAWEGGTRLVVYTKIVDGPNDMLDRTVRLTLPFEWADKITEVLDWAKQALAEQQRRLDDINARNSE